MNSLNKLNKKICLLGDPAVGKTCLTRRFLHRTFDDKYPYTMGIKVSRKAVALTTDAGLVELGLVLWDVAGGEEYDALRAGYLRGAAGAVLVCDLTRPATLDSLERYIADLREMNPDARFVIAANKLDLVEPPRAIEAHVHDFAAAVAARYFLTSAKTGVAVEPLFRELGRYLVGP